MVFNLDQGRRNDPVEAQQLVASIKRQEAISQAVLAQQLGSLADPSIIPGRGNLDPLDLRRQLALARGGAVGFMPIIITLPEGTSLIATGGGFGGSPLCADYGVAVVHRHRQRDDVYVRRVRPRRWTTATADADWRRGGDGGDAVDGAIGVCDC